MCTRPARLPSKVPGASLSADRRNSKLESGRYQITDRHAIARRRTLSPGRDFPRDEQELQRFIGSEEAALRFLTAVRWPRGFRCPECKARGRPQRGPEGLLSCGSCAFLLRTTADTIFEKGGAQAAWLRVLWREAEGSTALGPDALGELLEVADPLLGALHHERLRAVERRLVSPPLRGTCEVGLCRVKVLGPLRRGGRERVDAHVLLVAEEASERIRLVHLSELDQLAEELGRLVLSTSALVTRHPPLAKAVGERGFRCEAIDPDDLTHPDLLDPIAQRLQRWLRACPEASEALLDGFLAVFAFRHERRLDPPGTRFFRLAAAAMEPLAPEQSSPQTELA